MARTTKTMTKTLTPMSSTMARSPDWSCGKCAVRLRQRWRDHSSLLVAARAQPVHREVVIASYPPRELAPGQVADHRHAGLAVVEAGDGGEILAPAMAKNLGVLDRD